MILDDDYAARLHDLGENVPPGPWHAHRSAVSGDLLVWDGDEPLLHVYGGIDLAKWICETAPAILLGGAR